MTAAPPTAALHVADAMAGNASLSGLVRRLSESKARFACIEPLLPAALCGSVQAGGLDDTTWSLLVPHGAAAAAKLRQLLPSLEARLLEAGWPAREVRLRILHRG